MSLLWRLSALMAYALMSHADEAVEHHILLMKVGMKDTDIDRYFRIVFDRSGADWTFICPPGYKDIPYKEKRIEMFYKDGFAVISEFLHTVGYLVGINIPKRYKICKTFQCDAVSECPLAEHKLNSTPKRSEKRLIIVSNLHKFKKLTQKSLTKGM